MIGLDLGTTNCKAVLLDAERRVRAGAAGSYKLQYRNLIFFYKQHHREYRALRRGMAAMGETLENLKESYE